MGPPFTENDTRCFFSIPRVAGVREGSVLRTDVLLVPGAPI